MVKVYFETPSSNDLVATLANETLYAKLYEKLEEIASKHGAVITEEVNEESTINDYEQGQLDLIKKLKADMLKAMTDTEGDETMVEIMLILRNLKPLKR